MLPQTGVTFSCDDAALQKLFDEAERKCLHNLKDFGADAVLVEGGGSRRFGWKRSRWAVKCTGSAT